MSAPIQGTPVGPTDMEYVRMRPGQNGDHFSDDLPKPAGASKTRVLGGSICQTLFRFLLASRMLTLATIQGPCSFDLPDSR